MYLYLYVTVSLVHTSTYSDAFFPYEKPDVIDKPIDGAVKDLRNNLLHKYGSKKPLTYAKIEGIRKKVWQSYENVLNRAVSFHPVPLAMSRVVFLSRKKIDETFQSNATFFFSKIK